MLEKFNKLFKKELCGLCKKNKIPINNFKLNVKTSDGLVNMKLCKSCADFFKERMEKNGRE